MPRVSRVVATQSIHPRAMDAARLVALAEQHGRPAEAVIPVEKAITAALQLAGKDAAVVATGSLFIAAAVREIWKNHDLLF